MVYFNEYNFRNRFIGKYITSDVILLIKWQGYDELHNKGLDIWLNETILILIWKIFNRYTLQQKGLYIGCTTQYNKTNSIRHITIFMTSLWKKTLKKWKWSSRFKSERTCNLSEKKYYRFFFYLKFPSYTFWLDVITFLKSPARSEYYTTLPVNRINSVFGIYIKLISYSVFSIWRKENI